MSLESYLRRAGSGGVQGVGSLGSFLRAHRQGVGDSGAADGQTSRADANSSARLLAVDGSRLARALQQRIFLLDRPSSTAFHVMGNSGTAYMVLLSPEDQRREPMEAAWRDTFPNCTCPDHTGRGLLCKHILFVLVKVLGIRPDTVRAGLTLEVIARACGGGGRASSHTGMEHRTGAPRATRARTNMMRTDPGSIGGSCGEELGALSRRDIDAKPVQQGEVSEGEARAR